MYGRPLYIFKTTVAHKLSLASCHAHINMILCTHALLKMFHVELFIYDGYEST